MSGQWCHGASIDDINDITFSPLASAEIAAWAQIAKW